MDNAKKKLDLNYIPDRPIVGGWDYGKFNNAMQGIRRMPQGLGAVGGAIKTAVQTPSRILFGDKGTQAINNAGSNAIDYAKKGLSNATQKYKTGSKDYGVAGGLMGLASGEGEANTSDKSVSNNPPPAATGNSLIPSPQWGVTGDKNVSKQDINVAMPNNRMVNGLPTSMSSEKIATNGNRSYTMPGDNGNPYQLDIAHTGTGANGYGNFDVKSNNGQSGTVSASPGLMKNYLANKGSFGIGGLNAALDRMQKQPDATQQTEQMQQPIGMQQMTSNDYTNAINHYVDVLNSAAPTDSFDAMIAHKKAVGQAQAGLNALSGLQAHTQQSAVAREGLAADYLNQQQQNEAERKRAEADAAQNEFNQQLGLGKFAYGLSKDEAASKAASEQQTYERNKPLIKKFETTNADGSIGTRYGAVNPQTGKEDSQAVDDRNFIEALGQAKNPEEVQAVLKMRKERSNGQ